MEFYNLANFANLDCLGKESQFKKRFIDNKDVDWDFLNSLYSKFMLRRTSEVMTEYLNVSRTEYAVFLRPNDVQKKIYIDSTVSKLTELGSSVPSDFLTIITELQKVAVGMSPNTSSKLDFLRHFLNKLKTETNEKEFKRHWMVMFNTLRHINNP
ncbi:hypothetical protein FF38_04142 [Lucilia cuprina]|uniref:SNF2 N-terminal domain-containing protein n=1 Tax=Lucilia cuprina TaxID=7375 RepID=A0A0L0C181_LUCCU|nr:hypothetical protein FF38_04142 [Lucilia cuprina]